MPDMSQIEKNKCERQKAHNNVEKKRKDKLKIALNDFKRYLPASITKNKKLSHHEVLLKAMEYMTELEKENKKLLMGTSDVVKGEIIENLKNKLDDSYKEIGSLKKIIEKNCMTMHSVDLIQSWKSKEKANKACQVSRGSTQTKSNYSSSLSHQMDKNKKQKKGFTIAQRLNHASTLSGTSDLCSSVTNSNLPSIKPCMVLDGQCFPLDTSNISWNSRFAESNAIILCYNDKVILRSSNDAPITSLNVIPTQQVEVSTNGLLNNSVTLTSGHVLPVSTFPLLPCLDTGISYLPSSSTTTECIVVGDKQQESQRNETGESSVSKKSEKLKHRRNNPKRLRVLHCCNWFWRNMKGRRTSFGHSLKVRKNYGRTSTTEDSAITIEEHESISNMVCQALEANVENSVSKENIDVANKDIPVNTESFDSSISSTSKLNKPIWIVAKNMTDHENNSSVSKDYGVDSCNLPSRMLPGNFKAQSNSSTPQRLEAASLCSHNNSQLKSDYHEISSLLLNPISSFPDLYDRNTTNKVDQSYMEDSSFYGAGVSYLNDDNDLQFEIEDDMFPHPSNSPFTNQVSFEKGKHKDGRKDFNNFSFHNEVFNFANSDSFNIQSSFNSIEKSSYANAIYRQMSPQNSNHIPSSTFSNNVQHNNLAFPNIDLRLAKTTTAIYTQSCSTISKPTFLHASEKNGFLKNDSNYSNKASNTNCMFDSMDRSHFSDNVCPLTRFQDKGNKNFNSDLKLAQNTPYGISQCENTNTISVFNPYSNYNYEKMWPHNSSMTSFLTPRASFNFQESHVNDILKNTETSQMFNNHFSSFATSKLPTNKDKCFTSKTSSVYFESNQNNENEGTIDSTLKFFNSINIKEKNKSSSYSNDVFPISGEGMTKVVYTANHQMSTATKLWNLNQYALTSKPFSFYPLSYNDGISNNVFNAKNTNSDPERVGEFQRIVSESNMFRTDNFSNSFNLSSQDEGFKSNSNILSFVPPIKTSFSFEELETANPHSIPSNFTGNPYSLLHSGEIHSKPNEQSGNWSKNVITKSCSNNFVPFLGSSSISDNSESNSFHCQTSPISHLKVNSFSGGSCKSLDNSSLNSVTSVSSLKRIVASSSKSSKRVHKVNSQDLFSKNQKPAYYGNYSNHNSYYSSDLLVGAFDKPTYLTNEDQFIPSYNSSEQVSELNLNTLFAPPLPSHQPNDVGLGLYHSQCSTGFPPTTTTLSSTKFSSALPSIHHFGISSIFTDFSNPLTFTGDANNLSTLRATQTESFITSPHYYRDNTTIAPTSGFLETNHYSPHITNIFNNHSMKQTNSITKNSMSINNLLGN